MTFPPAFWTWVKWKDNGAKGNLPPGVRAYYLAHGISRAPKAWQDRYLIHTGGTLPIPKPPPPPPPPPEGWVLGQRCVYFSNVTDFACQKFAQLGPKFTALVTADPGPDNVYRVTDAQIATLRSGGGKVASWCDSSSTPYSAAVQMQQQRGLDFASGQAENCGQWRQAVVDGHTTLVIGEPAVLRDQGCLDQAITFVNAGHVKFIGEVLHPNPNYSAQGVNISSVAFYVDMDEEHGGYQPLVNFTVMSSGLRAACSIYAGSRMSPDDWNLYAAWTR